MSHPIPEDLQEVYERISALEAELREAKQDLQNGEAMYIAMRNRCASVEQENAQLKQQVERLSAPVSDEEWDSDWDVDYPGTMSGKQFFDAIIAARLKGQDGTS